MQINRPKESKANYYQSYIDTAEGESLIETLIITKEKTHQVLKRVNDELAGYAYAPEKWSIKQVMQHIIDCERVFAYRAMRMARRDATPLIGFYENEFAKNDHTDRLSIAQIEDEYDSVRNASVTLYQNINPDVLDFEGTANDMSFSPRSLGWITAGHNTHHLRVITSKYLAME